MRTRLELKDGKWADIKERISVGEERLINSFSEFSVTSGESFDVGALYRNAIARVATRVVNWAGFVDTTGKEIGWMPGSPFNKRVELVERMDRRGFNELRVALDQFEADQAAADDQEKNVTADGETNSEATSLSAKP